MKFRKSIEIGEMVCMNPPFLPKLQVGQWITVSGNPGRFVGVSPGNVVWIVWPNTVGRKNVNKAMRIQSDALRNLRKR
jgi:hypothetical protein